MKKKRTYRAESVEQVRVAEVIPLLVAGCIVALDVAKAKFVVSLATWAGQVLKLFRFEHPTETRQFLSVVDALVDEVGLEKVRVVMEPTGTYGDAIRYQLGQRGVSVHAVSPKRTHDSREVFDGVPSMHDPKSALLIAKLSSMDLSREWKTDSEAQRCLRALTELRRQAQERRELSFSRLEGLLARHWPEYSRWFDLRAQKTAARVLIEYQGPAKLRANEEHAMEFLRSASRRQLSVECISGVIADARTSLGVPMLPAEERLVRSLAERGLESTEEIEMLDREIAEAGEGDEVFARLAALMGTYTAAVLVRCDVLRCESPRQLEKAFGLNLREKSSGEHRGRHSITKRGPGVARQVVYLFALRMIKTCPIARAWYERRRGYSEGSKTSAVVALMRKLVRALFHVARGASFDPQKLFDVRRLDLDASADEASPTTVPVTTKRRTEPRSIVGRKRGGGALRAST
jgi:transposase